MILILYFFQQDRLHRSNDFLYNPYVWEHSTHWVYPKWHTLGLILSGKASTSFTHSNPQLINCEISGGLVKRKINFNKITPHEK